MKTVKIIVGDEIQEIFYADKELLCWTSLFFRRMLNSELKEAESLEVQLPEDNAVVFRHYLAWLNIVTSQTEKDHLIHSVGAGNGLLCYV